MSTYSEYVKNANQGVDAAGSGEEVIALVLAQTITSNTQATLALAEQQRIANLIALATVDDPTDEVDLLRIEATNVLVKWILTSPDDEHPEIRPDIADALGIGGEA